MRRHVRWRIGHMGSMGWMTRVRSGWLRSRKGWRSEVRLCCWKRSGWRWAIRGHRRLVHLRRASVLLLMWRLLHMHRCWERMRRVTCNIGLQIYIKYIMPIMYIAKSGYRNNHKYFFAITISYLLVWLRCTFTLLRHPRWQCQFTPSSCHVFQILSGLFHVSFFISNMFCIS